MNRRQLCVRALGAAVSVAGIYGSIPSALAATNPEPTLVPQDQRGGLGLTGEEFRALWGEPDSEYRLDGGYYFESWYTIEGIDLEDGHRLSSIVIVPDTKVGFDSTSAILCGQRYVPEDSVEIDRFPRPNGPGLAVVYHSDWLAERFSDKEKTWRPSAKAGEIGDFCIWYWSGRNNELERLFVSTGRDPYHNYDDYD
jgi:hypothetical protein